MNSNYDVIEKAIKYISENFKDQPQLDEVSNAVNISPFYLQKMFSEWVGISPKRYLQFITTEYLKSKISESKNLMEIADSAGLSAQSRVYDLFVTLEAVTPNQYKTLGENLEIEYGFHDTPFGTCFIAITERGICNLDFIQNEDKSYFINNVKKQWNNANIKENKLKTSDSINKIFSNNKDNRLHLFVKGTNFQIKVWEALLNIPLGSLTTYQHISELIGNPKSVRAVANAVANNSIAYLIPCHRVIRKEGKIGKYKWGSERKSALLNWEMMKIS